MAVTANGFQISKAARVKAVLRNLHGLLLRPPAVALPAEVLHGGQPLGFRCEVEERISRPQTMR
jgi:hypothetical protein